MNIWDEFYVITHRNALMLLHQYLMLRHEWLNDWMNTGT